MYTDAHRWCWETCGGSSREMPPGSPGNHWFAVPVRESVSLNQPSSISEYMFCFENEDTAFEVKVRFG